MDSKEKILGIIRQRGPIAPMQLAKELKVESFMASAMLSELVSEKKVKISSLKVGSSPLYYLPGQQDRLEQFVGSLNEKDRRTYALLKDKKVIQDKAQDPLTRVSLRAIKDFAIPLEVTVDSRTELFWRWFLLPPNETEDIIKQLLGMAKKPEEKPKEQEQKPLVKQEPKQPQKPIPKDGFFRKLQDYFEKNSITILQSEAVRKNEFDFILKVPSAVGELTYFCNAKAKQKINGGDLAAAYVKAENKKLPVLFLTTGELTKQAKEMCNREFKNLAVKKI
jgi:hypothetical protein